MDDDRQKTLLTALGTEYFALQNARGQTASEMTGRAALYLATVSSTLIALGFTAGDRSAFVPFAAAVLPSLLILGEFTFIRLVAASIEDLRVLVCDSANTQLLPSPRSRRAYVLRRHHPRQSQGRGH
jgi:hypothetical protein